MKIIIITQDDPFFLGDTLEFLLKNLPSGVEITAAIVADVSPFGKKESFIRKAYKTFKIFGLAFFLRYSIKFIVNKFFKPNSVKRVLDKNNVKLINLNESINSQESLKKINNFNPDLLISIAGNEIFKRNLINLAPKGCLNLHTALLPKYRGLMPTFWVLRNREKETGVSVFFVDEGIDSGPILVQKRFKINNMSQQQLIKFSKRIGMEAIIEAIKLIKDGDYNLIENDSNNASYFSFPTRSDVIKFKKNGAKFF